MNSPATNIIDLNFYGEQRELEKPVPFDLGDSIAKFHGELTKAGYGSPEIEADGVLHRFSLPDDKGGAKTGWFVFYPDGIPSGAFGNWREGSSILWCSKARYEMTAAECAEQDQRMERARAERAAKQAEAHAKAAIRAQVLFQKLPAATVTPYLKKKGVKALGDIRVIGRQRDVTVIPLYGKDTQIKNLQFVQADGKKRFLADAEVKGNFYLIDGDRSIMFVAEGYSTGASIHMATGQAVIVAFNAGNLSPAIASAKAAFPGSKLIIAADDDKWTKNTMGEPWNPGQEKGLEASKKHGVPMVTPAFKDLSKRPTDFNDLHVLENIEAVQAQLAQAGRVSTRDKLRALTVKKEYVAMLGKEMWLLQNLIIKGQITTIIAKSGGGKTSVFFDFVTPWIIKNHDMNVFYFDCDSPASDHDTMLRKAEEIGPRFQWINPLTHGQGPEALVDALKEFVASGERLDDSVFILDTLKKFIDMLDKKSVKPFFNLLRQLTALGATIILLGHANKHRDNNGNLVFEGVGDVASDTDAMIIFERMKAMDGGIDITTICDPDKGAKVRGLYQSISFHIAPDRTVTLCRDVVPVPDYSREAAKKGRLTEEDIQERIQEYLQGYDEPVSQSQILDDLKGEPGISFHALRKTLIACAGPEYAGMGAGQIFYRNGFTHNKRLYGVSR